MRAPLTTLDSPSIQELRARCGEHAAVVALLGAAIAQEPAAMVRDGDVIAPGYIRAGLRRIGTHTDEFLLEPSASANGPGFPDWKLGYNRVQGFFIEIARRDAGDFPDDMCGGRP